MVESEQGRVAMEVESVTVEVATGEEELQFRVDGVRISVEAGIHRLHICSRC